MPSSLISPRDRAILRSFARRIDPSDAGAHNNLGVLYFNKGLHEEAVAAFTRALELDPKMQVAQRNLEIAALNTGYHERHMTQLGERLRAHPEDRDARWEIGRAHAALGEWRDAIAHFTTLLRYHPNDVAALVQLGLAEKASGSLEDAQRSFGRAAELDPNSSLAHLYVGEVLYNRGRSDDACAALGRAIALNPDNPDAHFLMSFVLGDLGRHEEARHHSKRAVQLNPALARAQTNLSLDRYQAAAPDAPSEAPERKDAQRPDVSAEGQLAHYGLGLAFRQKGYLTEAMREYEMALARGEDEALVRQATAELHLLAGRAAEALAAYDRLVELQPTSPKLWSERGVALHLTGRHAEAGDSYRRAVALDPGYAIAHNNLGVALYHGGETEDAIDAFRAALAEQPGFVKAWLNFALLMLKTRRHQLSLEAYRRALQASAEHPVAWNGIGLVLVEFERFEEARNAFGRAVQSRPDYAEAHYNLSFAVSRLGDVDGALRATRRALELDPYYVAQKFELAIDLEYEDPRITVVPDLAGEQRTEAGVVAFAFDPSVLDSLFTELAPARAAEPAPGPAAEPVPAPSPYATAREWLAAGLLERAAGETSRAMARGAEQAEGLVLHGEIFARQGLHGEALERFRAARALEPHADVLRQATLGEARALHTLGRSVEARPLVERLHPTSAQIDDGADIASLALAAEVLGACGETGRALELLGVARHIAPESVDVLRRLGDVSRVAGDRAGAIAAYRAAASLDGGYALVRFELGRLLAAEGKDAEAEGELSAALDIVPTYVEAAMELATLRRRARRPDDALDPLIALLRCDPYNLDALCLLGETLLDLRRRGDAAVAFERVLHFDPRHPVARERMMELQQTLARVTRPSRRTPMSSSRITVLVPRGRRESAYGD